MMSVIDYSLDSKSIFDMCASIAHDLDPYDIGPEEEEAFIQQILDDEETALKDFLSALDKWDLDWLAEADREGYDNYYRISDYYQQKYAS